MAPAALNLSAEESTVDDCTAIKDDEKSDKGAPSTFIAYDNDGDLVLHVGSRPSKYRVCSKTLARSSPVFKKMLFGGFAESRPSGSAEWIVELPDDRSKAMGTFLSIIHGTFHAIPSQMSLGALYSLLTLTEKYDATALVRPWAHSWTRNVSCETHEPKLLCIAWELGDAALFGSTMAVMIENCILGTDDQLLYGRPSWDTKTSKYSGPPTTPIDSIEYLRPVEILETVSSNRQLLLEAELQPFLELFESFTTGKCALRNYYDTSDCSNWRCDSTGLGSLFKSFASHNVNIADPYLVKTYPGTITDLRTTLDQIKVQVPHNQCQSAINGQLRESRKLAGVARKAAVFIRPRQQEYLDKQKKKMEFCPKR